MIYGIGIDIVEIYKIKKIVMYRGDKLAQRILSIPEWRTYRNKNRSVHFLATRFAVKEAASKALGTGICRGITFAQFEVFNDTWGKPVLRLLSYAKLLAEKLALKNMHVSVSDTSSYACAVVIFER